MGTAGIFIFGMLLSFAFNWAITKYMNQNEVGLFQYYISIITFAMVIVPIGYQGLAQREAVALGKNGLIKLQSPLKSINQQFIKKLVIQSVKQKLKIILIFHSLERMDPYITTRKKKMEFSEMDLVLRRTII